MSIVLNGTTGITTPDVSVTAQSSDIVTSGNIEAVNATLSGGVYVGGTAAANLLDDYEEGTWTPVLSSTGTAPTVSSYSNQLGYYTKVGNVVTIHCHIRASISSVGSGTPRITGLPFTAVGYPGIASGLVNLFNGGIPVIANTYASSSEVLFSGCSYGAYSNAYITFTTTYQVT